MLGTGEGVRDFIYITDIAEAICRYAELELATCSTSNISTGNGVSVKTITDMLIDISGKEIRAVWGDPKDNGTLYKVLSNNKMISDIGYTPKIDLRKGLEQATVGVRLAGRSS